jgi:penicillin G amidase
LTRRSVALTALAAAGAVLLAALVGSYLALRASLPPLDGARHLPGITSSVAIERDALGVVTVTAASREDLAYGTGFAHGQDRFFQMDLARRLAAGELSELVGPAALAQDAKARLFRFRALARGELGRASPAERALLLAYTRGVNAGVASLASRPWEYWLLGSHPAPWRLEDSFLVAYAMWWDLQYGDLARDRLRRTIDARLGGQACGSHHCALEFLYPGRSRWDAPNVADDAALRAEDARDAVPQPVPGPEALDVRGAHGVSVTREDAEVLASSADIGSNSWALAGRLTASGAALVASDMHLGLQVPPTWYRMRLRLRGPGGPATRVRDSALDLNGLTLPGSPVLIAGSNGQVAWAFTNSGGAWLEAHPVECLAVEGSRMRTPQGDVELATVLERIRVRGGADVPLPVRSAAQGVLFDVEQQAHRCWFAAWLVAAPGASNMSLLALERARSAQEALALAPQIGIPHQNLVVGDAAGHIGWTIAGRIPRGSGEARSSGTSGWLAADEAPRLYDPQLGRLWTANARASTDPAALAAIGGEDAPLGAQYALGARARQIRAALLALPPRATAGDMLSIQLDDRGVFLGMWRDLILGLLDAPTIGDSARRAHFKRLVEAWDARAAVDSVGYRLVRAYHDRVANAVWQMILGALTIESHDAPPPQFEQPLWTLVTEQPLDMLAARYPSWHAFLLAELDRTALELERQCGTLDRCRWGAAHPVHIVHPLSRALPWLSWLIDYPPLELPGDHDMPRVQSGAFGASERFAVAPGHEAEGYLELPGGQTDQPLSQYFRTGFHAWAVGEARPLLPGTAEHRLLLQPSAGAVH